MSIASTADWKGLKRVANVVRLTLDALAAGVKPGVTTGELDAIAGSLLRRHGARSAPAMVYGFPRTVLISVNDEIVHGIPGDRRIAAGDLSAHAVQDADGWTLRTRDGSLSAHHEHTLVITRGAPIVLTAEAA
jgi:methionyl aminopeptidase